MRRMLVREALGSLVRMPRPLASFYDEVMRRKKDDHHASHSDLTNQLFHIVTSSVFIGCYALALWDLTTAMWAGLAALFLRQLGHAILEPPCHDKEALLLGYNTRNKSLILGAYLAIPLFHLLRAPAWNGETLRPVMATVAEQWFLFTLTVVVGRVLYLLWAQNAWLALVWLVKLVTDPLTDLIAYSPRDLRRS